MNCGIWYEVVYGVHNIRHCINKTPLGDKIKGLDSDKNKIDELFKFDFDLANFYLTHT